MVYTLSGSVKTKVAVKQNTKSRIAYIDELRGLAALLVLASHYTMAYWPHSFINTFGVDNFAVAIFFCISGRIVPHSVRDNSFDSVKRFFISRVFRLFPAYWFAILLSVIFLHPTIQQVFANMTMVQQYIGSSNILGVFWTLEIEILFYALILFSCLTGIFYKKYTFISFAIFFGFFSLIMGLMRYYMNIRTHIAIGIGLTFMCGMAAYYFYTGLKILDKKTLIKVGFITLLLLYLACFFGYSKDWGFNENPYKFLITYTVTILFFLAYSKWQPGIKILKFFGTISYPLYLVHEIPLFMSYKIAPDANVWITKIICFAISIVAAWLMHLYIEKPGIALGRKLIRRYTKFPA